MAPDERRAALVAATVPLLREHGAAVTTRHIADAAGVAEGTIFGVFPDKASLLRAAVVQAFDPEPLVAAMAAIPRSGPLRARLRAVVELLGERFAANEPLIAASRSVTTGPDDAREFVDRLQQSRQRILAAVAAVMEPDRAHLRRDPDNAARLLFMLVMATVHRWFDEHGSRRHLDSDEVVSVLLDGLLARPVAAGADPQPHSPTGGRR
jgi:AcrR family transcriptional regulator